MADHDQFAAIINIKVVRQRPADGPVDPTKGQQWINASVTTIESSAIGSTQAEAVTAAAQQDIAEFIEGLNEKRLVMPAGAVFGKGGNN